MCRIKKDAKDGVMHTSILSIFFYPTHPNSSKPQCTTTNRFTSFKSPVTNRTEDKTLTKIHTIRRCKTKSHNPLIGKGNIAFDG
jgi:hypothetical protein